MVVEVLSGSDDDREDQQPGQVFQPMRRPPLVSQSDFGSNFDVQHRRFPPNRNIHQYPPHSDLNRHGYPQASRVPSMDMRIAHEYGYAEPRSEMHAQPSQYGNDPFYLPSAPPPALPPRSTRPVLPPRSTRPTSQLQQLGQASGSRVSSQRAISGPPPKKRKIQDVSHTPRHTVPMPRRHLNIGDGLQRDSLEMDDQESYESQYNLRYIDDGNYNYY